ncbi:MAG: SGNH/GDSL hydrolase family protein [Bythopirellula sp.]|nr:SGNH/GDSL hydrolase family protein [Bythopirellula sp.]
MGFGRSYGKESGFLGKKFSGIYFSKIWEALESETSSTTIAFVTDVGNDLGYEQPVEAIMEWVATCVSRLRERGAQVALTDVPIEALRGVSHAKFSLLRSIFFPSCRLSWSELLARAEELSARLGELAKSQKVPIFSVPNDWYGFDPIHPRSAHLRDYWSELFALLAVREAVTGQRRLSWPSYWRLRTLTSPGLGQKVSPVQFSASRALLREGTSITLY